MPPSSPHATPRPPPHGAGDLAQFQARMDQLWAALSPPSAPGAFEAHTDGACLGNPDGPGGWAAVVRPLDAPTPPWELWGHLTSTSNNRAEALGLLAAVEWVPAGSTLAVRSDSELTVKLLSGAYRAKANLDLWTEIRRTIAAKQLTVRPAWVRGHAGDPGNERADALSVLGAVNGDLERCEQIRPGAGRTAKKPPRQPASAPLELEGLRPQSAWEESFLSSVARQLRAGRTLSPKQEAIVARIRARASSGRAPPPSVGQSPPGG